MNNNKKEIHKAICKQPLLAILKYPYLSLNTCGKQLNVFISSNLLRHASDKVIIYCLLAFQFISFALCRCWGDGKPILPHHHVKNHQQCFQISHQRHATFCLEISKIGCGNSTSADLVCKRQYPLMIPINKFCR